MQVNQQGTNKIKVILSTLWVFYIVNILYADVLTLMGANFSNYGSSAAEDAEIISTMVSPEMLLGVAFYLELGMVMIVLSRFLKYDFNRWANIVIATLQALGLLASLFIGTPAGYYIFFVVVEVITLLFIVWYAWTWPKPTVAQSG